MHEFEIKEEENRREKKRTFSKSNYERLLFGKLTKYTP